MGREGEGRSKRREGGGGGGGGLGTRGVAGAGLDRPPRRTSPRRVFAKRPEWRFRETFTNPSPRRMADPAHYSSLGPQRRRLGVQRIPSLPPCGKLAALCLLLLPYAHAGGPAFVAGTSYFDPGIKGAPLVWSNNTVIYYTDQGDLSPVLPGPSADALIAEAFVHWTNIPTVALIAVQGGRLAEDVSGTTVTITNGVLSLPLDIQPTAVGAPVGIVYDQDGQITETLLGAGSSSDCLNDAVYGGLDNFTISGNFAHALVILNGMCVQDSTQLVDFEYRLVRVLGHVLGLDASQANLNVWTGLPVPTVADLAGFPVMHATDLSYCQPITKCLPTPDQPSMDDRAALGRLYPVTLANQMNYSGKSLFSGSTVRIHGVVSSPGITGPGQGMHGVNADAP